MYIFIEKIFFFNSMLRNIIKSMKNEKNKNYIKYILNNKQ